MGDKNQNCFENLTDTIKEKLAECGITEPTNVQKEVIPVVALGKSVLFQSETGTGKTYAYLLPLINKIEEDEDK